jgi:hypothetical protein
MRILLAVLALGSPWTGTWSNDAMGTSGWATLNGSTLRLAGGALGCVQAVSLRVRLRGSRVSGGGGNVPCSHGLRWRVSGTADDAVVQLRLADGSEVQLRLALHRR